MQPYAFPSLAYSRQVRSKVSGLLCHKNMHFQPTPSRPLPKDTSSCLNKEQHLAGPLGDRRLSANRCDFSPLSQPPCAKKRQAWGNRRTSLATHYLLLAFFKEARILALLLSLACMPEVCCRWPSLSFLPLITCNGLYSCSPQPAVPSWLRVDGQRVQSHGEIDHGWRSPV